MQVCKHAEAVCHYQILLNPINCDLCMIQGLGVISHEDSWHLDCLWQRWLCCCLRIGVVAVLMLVSLY